MVRKLCCGGLVVALSVCVTSAVSAQSILERLERRLNDAGVQLPAQTPNRVERTEAAPPIAGRGYLGMTADLKNGAVEVISVRAGGPADAAGVKPGDRLVSIGGSEVANLDDLAAIIEKLPIGSRLDTVVSRGGREQKLTLTVAAREPAVAEELPNPGNNDFPEERLLEQSRAALGVRALPVTTELQRRYGLVVRRGAVIDNVQPGSPAEHYGLPVGAAITAVDGARVDSPDDLAAIIAGARPGDTIEVSYYQRDQVFRKRVRLVPADPAMAVGPGEERPLLRRLERALGDPLPADRGAVAELQAQLDAMQAKVDALEARIRQLEGRLPASVETESDAQDKAPTKEPELAPALKPLEP